MNDSLELLMQVLNKNACRLLKRNYSHGAFKTQAEDHNNMAPSLNMVIGAIHGEGDGAVPLLSFNTLSAYTYEYKLYTGLYVLWLNCN